MKSIDKDIIEKAKEAKSSEELFALAQEKGVDITQEEAKEYFRQLHTSGELSDDELDSVAGGGCDSSTEVKCPSCGHKLEKERNGGHFAIHYHKCNHCGYTEVVS